MKTLGLRIFLVWAALWLGVNLSHAAQGSEGAASTATTNRTALKFATFQIGTRVYTNVTVTSRTETDVFIRHAQGIENFKVEELSPELAEKLGYSAPATKEEKPTVAAVPGKIQEVMARTITAAQNNEALLDFAKRVRARIRGEALPGEPAGAPMDAATAAQLFQELKEKLPQSAMIALSVFLVSLPILYFFFCYTARLVCQKAGVEPGVLVWLPLVSIVPLVRAAGLPGWVSVLFFLPPISLIVSIVWCFRIAKARGKTALTGLCLLFPPTAPGAWLYLAYSK